MKKRRLFLLSAVAAAAIMAACTADEMLSEGGKAMRIVASAEPTPIMVEALVDNGEWEDVPVDGDELHPASTRAVQTLNEGSLSTTVLQSMALYAYGQSANASGYTRYVLDTYNSTTKLFSASTMPVFPASETSVNVYGWYPAMDSTPKTFVVQSDQSSDENFIKSDLMLANLESCTRSKTSNVYSVTPAPLIFTHALSKINMNITPGDGVTITSVVINNVNCTATIIDASPASLSVSCAGNGSDNVTVWTGTHSSGQLQVSAVVPPQTLKNTFVTITANTSTKTGKTAVYSLGSTGKAFATGKKYVMNLTVNQQDITPRAHDISAWNTTAGTVEIAGNTTGGGGDIVLSEYEKTFTFGDANGTVIITGTGSYNVSSSNTNVATALVSGTTITIDPDHAGDATIFVSKANSGEYGIINVTVNPQTTGASAAPTAINGLTYTGSAQALVTAGTASSGTMKYSTSQNGTYTTTIPAETNANTSGYSVWWYVEQVDNSGDYTASTTPAQISGITIAKATPSATVSSSSLSCYKNGTNTFTVTLTGDGTITATSANTSLLTTSVDGTTVTVTGKGSTGGPVNVSIGMSEGTNYKASTTALATVAVTLTDYLYDTPATLAQLKHNLTNNPSGDYSSYIGYYVDASGNISSTNNSAVGVILYINSSSTVFVGTDSKSQTYYDSNADSNKSNARILVCALNNISTDMTWNAITSTTASEWGSAPSRPDGASKWFIPTNTQWSNMSPNRAKAGISGRVNYWSSTENNNNYAYDLGANSGNVYSDHKSVSSNARACFAY